MTDGQESLGPTGGAALAAVVDLDDHDIYRFVPEDALDPQTLEYFKASGCLSMSETSTDQPYLQE